MAILFKHFINNFLTNNNNDSWEKKLLKEWDQVVGNLNTRICLQKIQKETLVIGVYESHWMQELYLLSDLLINKINSYLGEKKVNKLRFKLINKNKKVYNKIFYKNKNTDVPKIKLNQKQERALVKIQDRQLKQVLTDFLACCVKNN